MGTRHSPVDDIVSIPAPAKLTLSLRVLGRRPDGLHELSAEMVALDLADELEIVPGGQGVEIEAPDHARAGSLSVGPDNLVCRALEALDMAAGVRLTKRIPVGGGLGGGSADAAAVLRWGGCDDLTVAATLGADVPFCLVGGRAQVRGAGELVEPLEFQARSFVLLVPPFAVDTGAVFEAFDELGAVFTEGKNDLTPAALAVEPRLLRWGQLLEEVTGVPPMLAGSGSTWFVEGVPEALGVAGRDSLVFDGDEAVLLAVSTVPARASDAP